MKSKATLFESIILVKVKKEEQYHFTSRVIGSQETSLKANSENHRDEFAIFCFLFFFRISSDTITELNESCAFGFHTTNQMYDS